MSTTYSIQDSPDIRVNTIVMDDLKEPDMYKVILLNDDYTTMDFVVEVLQEIFNKSSEEAAEIMMTVHSQGSGICGIYTFEIAEYKIFLVMHKAEDAGFPLKCTMEKA